MSGPLGTASQTMTIGGRIGDRYVIRRALGSGGMGQVFEVEHDALGKRFALKVLTTAMDEENLRRFHREARAAARLSSPRVAQIVDYGVHETIGPYYVMELLEGETLKERLDRAGRLALPEATPIAIGLADALAEVHAAGVVHRDLKPSNVGLPTSGSVPVKLLDFGLAVGVEDRTLERITRTQEFVGTIPYMAPEQLADHPPAFSMDLYALGVLLYEMLCGRLPYQATNAPALIAMHLHAPIPALAPDVPRWLGDVTARLLAKHPAGRYASAAEVAAALRAGAHVGDGIPITHITDRVLPAEVARRRLIYPAAAAALVAGAVILALALRAGPGSDRRGEGDGSASPATPRPAATAGATASPPPTLTPLPPALPAPATPPPVGARTATAADAGAAAPATPGGKGSGKGSGKVKNTPHRPPKEPTGPGAPAGSGETGERWNGTVIEEPE